jgi:hypothetical protein
LPGNNSADNAERLLSIFRWRFSVKPEKRILFALMFDMLVVSVYFVLGKFGSLLTESSGPS